MNDEEFAQNLGRILNDLDMKEVESPEPLRFPIRGFKGARNRVSDYDKRTVIDGAEILSKAMSKEIEEKGRDLILKGVTSRIEELYEDYERVYAQFSREETVNKGQNKDLEDTLRSLRISIHTLAAYLNSPRQYNLRQADIEHRLCKIRLMYKGH